MNDRDCVKCQKSREFLELLMRIKTKYNSVFFSKTPKTAVAGTIDAVAWSLRI